MKVNERLHGFSTWLDEFLLEVAKPLMLVGFAMGTVDIFTRGGMATWPLFNVPWAIVQAWTIDGLFFAVWYRIFSAKWKGHLATNLLLCFVGTVLALVATITNGILSLQQLQGISDSARAMSWLRIDPTAFTVMRAFLVVFVSVMVAFVYQHKDTVLAIEQPGTLLEHLGNSLEQPEQPENKTVPVAEQWNTDWNTLGNTAGTVEHSEEQWVEHSGTVLEQPRTVVEQVTEQPLLLAEYAENNDRDKIRIALSARMRDNRPINLVELAGETGVLYSRVRKLAPGIKKELGV